MKKQNDKNGSRVPFSTIINLRASAAGVDIKEETRSQIKSGGSV